jgi:crossover junction endodeoxyribonuclease RuvC
VKIFGIDPGSERTGYGCVETDGSRHRIVICGAITSSAASSFPERLLTIHTRLSELLRECRPDAVAIENLFFATNVRSALKLGHARGVAMLAAVEAGVPVIEYTPAEIKRAVVGFGRAEKHQVQHMVKLILGLAEVPAPHDAADALAVAICHVHSRWRSGAEAASRGPAAKAAGKAATSWRHYRPASAPPGLRQGKPASAASALRRGKPA